MLFTEENHLEQCICCEGLYELEKSTAELQECCCSKECEDKYTEMINEALDFV